MPHSPTPASPADDNRRLHLAVSGAVQGVGFRPFVYRLAADLGLTGTVLNDASGVHIEVEGPRTALATFEHRLGNEAPPLARIHRTEAEWLGPRGETIFRIVHSDASGVPRALVLPDVATCPDCLAELLDPADRRHGYAFTNCTNCGPRFSIIEALPYDRPATTMRGFTMCARCRSEYENPADRRFHAQPNACPDCGPQLRSWTGGRAAEPAGHSPLETAVQELRTGRIVALKGLGGFVLLADAASEEAVARLRRRKNRPARPLALMVADLEAAVRLCRVSAAERKLLCSAEAPIVLLQRLAGAPLAAGVAPGNPRVGVMLPSSPLHHLVARAFGEPLIATSGNLSDEPICTDNHEATTRLGEIRATSTTRLRG
jgi:hydrogenase maturation protein HypF